jgi:hypothetical protein
MTITYKITADDLYASLLYSVSKARKKKKPAPTKGRRILAFVVYALGAIMFSLMSITHPGLLFLAVLFALCAILIALSPAIANWRNQGTKKRCRRMVSDPTQEIAKNIGQTTIVTIDNDSIISKILEAETRLPINGITEINELPGIILISHNTVSTFYLSKSIDNLEVLTTTLKNLALRLHISYIVHDTWELK